MDKNYGRFYTPVNHLAMYKHGWKKRVGWAPIKESLAASILMRSGIIDAV
jgi:23S rRNA G2445 N2-methylase RlmL